VVTSPSVRSGSGANESTDHRGLGKAFGTSGWRGYALLVLFVGLGVALHSEREATKANTRSTSEACPTVARLLNPSWCSAGLRAPPPKWGHNGEVPRGLSAQREE
jgi:hypothetical protein